MNECTKNRRELSAELKQLRDVFLAMGDETRLQIFTALLESETIGMRVPDITRQTHLSRPAVSHHLQILKRAELIDMHRVGTKNYYYVNANTDCWDNLQSLVNHVHTVVTTAVKNGYPAWGADEAPQPADKLSGE